MHGMLGNYGTVDRDQFLFLLLWKSLTDSPASRLFPIRWFIKVMVPILKRYILKVPHDLQFILSRFLYHSKCKTCQRASRVRKQHHIFLLLVQPLLLLRKITTIWKCALMSQRDGSPSHGSHDCVSFHLKRGSISFFVNGGIKKKTILLPEHLKYISLML